MTTTITLLTVTMMLMATTTQEVWQWYSEHLCSGELKIDEICIFEIKQFIRDHVKQEFLRNVCLPRTVSLDNTKILQLTYYDRSQVKRPLLTILHSWISQIQPTINHEKLSQNHCSHFTFLAKRTETLFSLYLCCFWSFLYHVRY